MISVGDAATAENVFAAVRDGVVAREAAAVVTGAHFDMALAYGERAPRAVFGAFTPLLTMSWRVEW